MKANFIIRGHACAWSIDADLSIEEIDAMRADGVPVGVVVHDEEWTPPEWHPLSQTERRKRR